MYAAASMDTLGTKRADMTIRHVFFPANVRQQIEQAPEALRHIVEEHLEVVAALAQRFPVERLPELLRVDLRSGLFSWERDEGRVLYSVSPSTKSVIVHRVESATLATLAAH